MVDTFALTISEGLPMKAYDNGDGTCSQTYLSSQFSPPPETDAGTVEYPDAVTEIYKFRKGGVAGEVLRMLTVVYTGASKTVLLSWSAV